MERLRWCWLGGIVSLYRVIDEHESALDYDLMTRTGRTLHEYLAMGAAGIVALCHFLRHLPLDSATAAEVSGYRGIAEWSQTTKTNILMADIYDNISAMRYAFVQSKSKKGRAKKPDPYPRPWRSDGKKRIGRGAVPVSKFWGWWDAAVKRARKRGR